MNPDEIQSQGNSETASELDRLTMRLTTRGGPGLSRSSFPTHWEIIQVHPEHTNIFVRIVRRITHTVKSVFWRWRFLAFGKRSRIESPNWIRGAASISIGERVSLWRYARLTAVNAQPGREMISIGDGTVIHPQVHIAAVKSVKIGHEVLFAANCYITDHDHDWLHPDDPPITNGRVIAAPTSIGDHTWLGEGVAVLKGVTIGDHCVIGANSVVTQDIPPYTIAVGAPARVIRQWDHVLETWVPVDQTPPASRASDSQRVG